MRITKWERLPVGAGHDQLAHVMNRLERVQPSAAKIKALGNKIVKEEMAAVSSSDSEARA